MTTTEIRDQWLAAKSGIIEERDLVFARKERKSGCWFECPCGGEHDVYVPWMFEGFSRSLGDVLTCFVTNQQWLIRRPNVAETIFGEEKTYIKLLKNAPKFVRKVIRKRGWSEETKAFLMDTHGIDPEISQAVVDGTWPEMQGVSQ